MVVVQCVAGASGTWRGKDRGHPGDNSEEHRADRDSMDTSVTPSHKRLRQGGLSLVIWLVAGILVGAALRRERPSSMAELIAGLSTGIAWNVVLGLAVLACLTRFFRWTDLGFNRPDGRVALRLMWFPILTLLPIFALACAIGLPPDRAIGYLAINTALVALSEEWMFRGIVFRALSAHLRLWPAILLTAFLFGAVHVLNVFAMGDLGQATGQAVAATMTGLLLGALLLRTGSLWPPIVFHMFWNFGLLLVTYESAQQLLPEGPLPLEAYLVPLTIVMPNLFYALFLLRKVRNAPA